MDGMKRKPSIDEGINDFISKAKDGQIHINTDTNNNPNLSTNTSTTNSTINNTVIVREKVKYTDRKTQRAYWLDDDLVKIFDKNFPQKKYDKSEIMNQLLKNFLIDKGLI